MINLIAIIGEAGTGKDTLLNEVYKENPQVHKIISCTTRPKRDYEVNNIDYIFLTEEEFLYKIRVGDMLEYANFNNWYYGTALDGLNKNKINIGVFNMEGVCSLLRQKDINLIIYRLVVSKKERLLRQLNREQNPDVDEIVRRYNYDLLDFQIMNFDYTSLENENVDHQNYNTYIISQKIKELLGQS